jgi:hypothetical protein
LFFKGHPQTLCVCPQAREGDKRLISHLKDPLDILRYPLQLHTKTLISGNGDAIFSCHGHYGPSVIF